APRGLRPFPTRRSSDLRLVAEIGMYDALREEGPEGEDRVSNVEELVAGAAELENRLRSGDTELLLDADGAEADELRPLDHFLAQDRKSTRLNSSHVKIS